MPYVNFRISEHMCKTIDKIVIAKRKKQHLDDFPYSRGRVTKELIESAIKSKNKLTFHAESMSPTKHIKIMISDDILIKIDGEVQNLPIDVCTSEILRSLISMELSSISASKK